MSACVLNGDFDIQVDYQLLEWPARNGVRMGIATGPDEFAEIIRMSWGQNESSPSFDPAIPEVYLTNPNRAVIGTNDLSGKLRLTRIENVETGYYYDSVISSWIPLSSSGYTVSDVHLYLYAFSINDLFGDQEVKMAFDNLIVEGKKICKGRFTPANPPLF
ncbi:MAG: hypothetical protein Q8P92_01385 [Candidatus Daviesbacteria bacterium]|nr:hypothetical protein [Candidatus Daviesbacteria bacterium]